MKIVDDKLLDIPYFQRSEEENTLFSLISTTNLSNSISQVRVVGKSGTGKTTLVKKVLGDLLNQQKDAFILYNDLNYDEFASNLFLEMIIGGTFVPKTFNSRDASNIPEGKTFKSFVEKKNLKQEAKNKVYESLIQTLSFIPTVGTYLQKMLPKTLSKPLDNKKYDADFRLMFFEYLEFLTRDTKVYLILDNYQFLSASLRHKFEATIRNLVKNLMIVTVIRTEEEENMLDQYRSYQIIEGSKGIILNGLEEERISELIRHCFADQPESEINRLAEDCIRVTGSAPY